MPQAQTSQAQVVPYAQCKSQTSPWGIDTYWPHTGYFLGFFLMITANKTAMIWGCCLYQLPIKRRDVYKGGSKITQPGPLCPPSGTPWHKEPRVTQLGTARTPSCRRRWETSASHPGVPLATAMPGCNATWGCSVTNATFCYHRGMWCHPLCCSRSMMPSGAAATSAHHNPPQAGEHAAEGGKALLPAPHQLLQLLTPSGKKIPVLY